MAYGDLCDDKNGRRFPSWRGGHATRNGRSQPRRDGSLGPVSCENAAGRAAAAADGGVGRRRGLR